MTLIAQASLAALLLPSLLLPAAHAGDFWVEAGGPYTVDAGEVVTLSAADSNLDLCAAVEYAWDLDGDGSLDTLSSDRPEVDFDASDIDGPLDGPQDVTVQVQVTCWLVSDLASIDGTASATVSVQNIAPTISGLSQTATVVEGSPTTLRVDVDDLEPDDLLTLDWDFGDGQSATSDVSTTDASTTGELTHSYAQNGRYDLTVTVSDDDGGSDSLTGTVDVVNAAPTILGSPQTWAVVGQPWAFIPTVDDPGVDDLHTWMGTMPPGVLLDEATGALSWTPGDNDLGEHAFSLTVHDDGGGEDTLRWSLSVSADQPGDTGGSLGSRPIGDGSAQADPWADAYGIEGEGCRCSSVDGRAPTRPALTLLVLVGLVGLKRRRS